MRTIDVIIRTFSDNFDVSLHFIDEGTKKHKLKKGIKEIIRLHIQTTDME